MQKLSPVHFILTGGTIDSFYDGTKDTAVPHRHSVIPAYIKSLKLYHITTFTEVCMKDSREIHLRDRQKMLAILKKTLHTKIIITHGTYTMPGTAQFLKTHLKRSDQTVILTGSFIPLTGFSPSDAGFSLGFALAKIQELPPGIYICMNGKIFTPKEAAKNRKEGKFYSLFEG